MRRFFIDKIENMRDIGGYTINNQKRVKEGKIIRSNVATNLNESELEQLKNLGFTTIIDLRSDKEIEKKNGVFFNNSEFEYHHIGIKGDGKIPESKEKVLDSYIEMISGKEQIKKVFETIGNSKGGVIYYCNAGKDRTGVITALILKLLGVSDNDVAVDYTASGIFLENTLKEFAKENPDKKDLLKIVTPTSDTIFNLMKYINKNYTSVDGYLKSCNLENTVLNQIKEKYSEDNV